MNVNSTARAAFWFLIAVAVLFFPPIWHVVRTVFWVLYFYMFVVYQDW